MDKTKIMRCVKCISFTDSIMSGFCYFWNGRTSPKGYCTSFNRLPDEENDAGNEIETGVDASLEEIEDIDGDTDNAWSAAVPLLRSK